jgi:hypothetical protein
MWAINLLQKASSLTSGSLKRILFACLLGLSLSACVKMNDPESSQEFNSHIIAEINQSQHAGQSLISQRERLNGISLWLTTKPPDNGNAAAGQLVIKLFQANDREQPVSAISIDILPSWNNSQVDISFPPQAGPAQQSYYVQVESTGSTIKLHGRNENAYEAGNAFLDDEALDADFAFRLTYDYNSGSVLLDLSRWGSQALLLIPLGLTLFLPGWSLLDLTGVKNRFRISEQAALALGLSLALLPLLMLWSTIFHIRWSRSGILGGLGFLAGFYVFRFLIKQFRKRKTGEASEPFIKIVPLIDRRSIINGLSLVAILMVGLFVRLAMVRDLATPAWVDSVHHAMITRLIIESGNFPASYAPYMDFDVHNYHAGFHSGLAVFTWLSNLEIPQALLFYGQALNALAALGVYLLTTTYTRKPVAGLFAAFITSFFTPMPAYYTSWGRYTQLAGLLILPSMIVLIRYAMHHSTYEAADKRTVRTILGLAIVSMSGLFLVHYRVIAFAALLLAADFLGSLHLNNNQNLKSIKRWGLAGLGSLFGMILLTFTWSIPTISHIFLPKLAPPETTQAILFGDYSWRFLTTAYGKQTLVLTGLGFLWALIKKPRLFITFALWVILLLFFSNLDALKLPGGGFITGTSVVIMLFIPISVLGGYFLDELASVWKSLIPVDPNYLRPVYWSLIILALGASAAFGARQLLPIINPITILSRQADLPAIEWIDQNLPQDATFLINPFSWGFGLYAGNDGGYWISPATGALSYPPPALYGLGNQDYVDRINQISQKISDPENTPDEIWKVMSDNDIDYIYLGVRGGPLSPAALLESGLFEQIYDQGGVKILKISTPE